jgi:hypothetical protein
VRHLSLIRDAYRAEIIGCLATPAGALMLRSDRLAPPELADQVLAAAGLSQVR